MSHGNHRQWHHGSWHEWPIGAKILAVAGGLALVPALLALAAALTMWLWNWLMPAIFKLPAIGFWQAAGILVLSHLLFKGGMGGRFGHSRYRKARLREAMREPSSTAARASSESGAPGAAED